MSTVLFYKRVSIQECFKPRGEAEHLVLARKNTTCEFIQRLQNYSTKTLSDWSPYNGAKCERKISANKKTKQGTLMRSVLSGLMLMHATFYRCFHKLLGS